MDDEAKKPTDGACVNLLEMVLRMANLVDQLLRDASEKRAILEEEEKLNEDQLGFLEYDYDWTFGLKWR